MHYFEWAAGRVDGVRPGRCAAFGIPGFEEAVVLVEPRDDASPDQLARRVGAAAAARALNSLFLLNCQSF